MKICKICKQEKQDSEFADYSENCKPCQQKVDDSIEYLSGHYNEETAYVVDDYPYGRHRTKIRYWIETTKRGNRFCSQTLNPKTLCWNKPKKSTYVDVGVMTRDYRGYISWFGYGVAYTDKEHYNSFIEKIKDVPLNKLQLDKLHYCRAVLKTRDHLTVTVRARKYKHKVTGEITECVPLFNMDDYVEVDDNGVPVDHVEEERQRKEADEGLNKTFAYYYAKDDGKVS